MRNIDLGAERDFENRKAGGEDLRGDQSKFYWATSLSISKHIKQTCIEIKDKNVLEIGCASGEDATIYCEHVSTYTGVDISNVAIDNCLNLKLVNASFFCSDGHKLPLDDASVDCVIVNSLLHHLDLYTAFEEIKRVLTSDGVLIFREPLGTNPAFQLYRAFTPKSRTEDEKPFTFSDLRLMRKYFDMLVVSSGLDSFQFFQHIPVVNGFDCN